MRVLIVCDFFLKYASAQIEALSDAGLAVALLCRTHAGEFGGDKRERRELLDRVGAAGACVFEVPGRFRSLSAVPSLLPIRQHVHRWEPDLVHAHDNYDPRLLLLTRGFPLALTIHDPTPHPGAHALVGLRMRTREAWIRRASELVVHGDRLRDALLAVGGARRIAVVSHGATVLSVPLPIPEEPAVLFFGRLEAYKGLSVLVSAMHIVWQGRPDVRLIVAGAGPEAHRLPADPRIELHDSYIPEADVDALFARASLAVLPYTEASQSGAGLEALRRGVPIVVSNVGSLPDLINDSSLVVAPGDPAALASALSRCLDHDAEFRRAVLANTRERFSWPATVAPTLDVYKRVLKDSGQGTESTNDAGHSRTRVRSST